MAQKTGKCTNFGGCSLADNGQVTVVAGEADFVCPECGKRLIEVAGGSKSPKLLLWVGLVLVLGALGYFGTVFFKPNKPPTAVISRPAEGQAFFEDETVEIEVKAGDPDGTVKYVEFFLDGAQFGSPVTQAPYRVTLKGLSPGAHEVKAVGLDNKDERSAPAQLSFVVEAKQPPPPPPAPPVQEAVPVVPPSPPPAPVVTMETVLRLHGSNTIGAKLAPALAERLFKMEGALEIKRVAGNSPEEISIQGVFGEDKPIKVIEVHAHGSSTAFKDLEDGKCDLGMASRAIKAEEVEKLKGAGLGDLTTSSGEHVLALDGIAIIVPRTNKIQALTVEQASKIFSGEITDWSALKGAPGSIHVYARDDKSGTYDTFKSLVLKDRALVSTARRYEDSNQLSDDVAVDPAGIGFIGLPYIRSARAVEVAEKGAAPMLPSLFTVSREDYALARRLFLYTPEAPRNPWTLKFVEFALSDTGQEIVRREGFVDQVVAVGTGQPMTGSSGVSAKDPLAKMKKEAVPLSTSFRFRSGSDQLDNRALRDLDRVVQLLSQPVNKGKGLYLAGFADSRGSDQYNVVLSRSRALTVSEELKRRGVVAKSVDGFGPADPVATNDTEEGRDKNRRVEVWLEKAR